MENTEKDFFDELLEASLKNADFAKFYAKGRLRRSLAVALLRIRKSAGLTQSKLGEKVGWKQPYVARLERDNSDALAAIERLEQYSSACGVSTMMLFVDKQTGEVKSSLAIGDSPLIQKLAKEIEGALPHEVREETLLDEEKKNNPLHQRWIGRLNPVAMRPIYTKGEPMNIEIHLEAAHPTKYEGSPVDLLNLGATVSNVNEEFGAYPIKKDEKKTSRKHSKYSYGSFLRSK